MRSREVVWGERCWDALSWCHALYISKKRLVSGRCCRTSRRSIPSWVSWASEGLPGLPWRTSWASWSAGVPRYAPGYNWQWVKRPDGFWRYALAPDPAGRGASVRKALGPWGLALTFTLRLQSPLCRPARAHLILRKQPIPRPPIASALHYPPPTVLPATLTPASLNSSTNASVSSPKRNERHHHCVLAVHSFAFRSSWVRIHSRWF